MTKPSKPSVDRICVRPDLPLPEPTAPLTAPIQPTSVWRCETTAQADALLGGELSGYVYQRDGHPNADQLAERIRELHGAERAAMLSSGMAALAAVVLSQLRSGDHLVVSDQLYGRSSLLLEQETERLGMTHTAVNICDLDAVAAAMLPETRLIVAETLANPRLRCADIPQLAELAHKNEALLLVDNTFATPALCQPLRWGADIVMESVSKMMNGHSDVMLGALCGKQRDWERMARVIGAWGLASSPFDCWLASRGLATMALRMDRACASALAVAEHLQQHAAVAAVDYPLLPEHPDAELAARLCNGKGGSIVTLHLHGGREAADRFIRQATDIPFCPSLGEICTTVSHPASTSHRGLTEPQREKLGISGGTLRLSIGLEQADELLQFIDRGLASE
ncbi:MAG: aminotransferase class I/II-fold pyridoxal phosphate-dependent enzyme [Planctomycetales bacterium]|nr:aminotransferase class I/II-fold pyridoxal phosphate-dependent enzyme [Planctomycetales bacterium]